MSALPGIIIFAIGVGGELVAQGAKGIIAALGAPITHLAPLTLWIEHLCFSLYTLNLPDQHDAERS